MPHPRPLPWKKVLPWSGLAGAGRATPSGWWAEAGTGPTRGREAATEVPMLQQPTVLVACGEPAVAEAIEAMLRAECRVRQAASAQEGLALLRAQEVHVVLA